MEHNYEKNQDAIARAPERQTLNRPAGGAHDAILALQQEAGNRAVATLLEGSSGRPLDPGTREQMEAKFEADFGDVRVHNDEEAAKTAVSVGARAVTTGEDIVFGPDFYAPDTSRGKRLLAHELAHVVQQRGEGGPTVSHEASEAEARRAGADVVAGGAASITSSATPGAQLDQLSLDEQKKLLQRQMVFGGQGSSPLVPKKQQGQDIAPPQTPGKKGDQKTDALSDAANDLLARIQKDPIVKAIRDWAARVQPFEPEADMKKALNDAMGKGLKEASKAGIKGVVEAASGKPTNEPEELPGGGYRGGPQLGPSAPITPQGEHIFKSPEIPIPDTPDLKPSTRFQYKGLRQSYSPGASMDLTVVPPKGFSHPGARVRIVPEAERTKVPPDTDLGAVYLDEPKPKSVELAAPSKPGKYVIRVDVGFGSESEEDFEVTEAKKSQ